MDIMEKTAASDADEGILNLEAAVTTTTQHTNNL